MSKKQNCNSISPYTIQNSIFFHIFYHPEKCTSAIFFNVLDITVSKVDIRCKLDKQLIAPATSTTQNFTEKINFLFCINVNKNAKENCQVLGGFWVVTKIKTDTSGACFSYSCCNQLPPITHKVKAISHIVNLH